MHPDVGFRLKLERALFGEGNLFPGESRLHRLWQKAGADFSNRVNRFMYSVEKLQKIAGEKLPDAKNPWTRYVNFLGLNNKFFDTMENGPIDPANPFRRMSEGPMHIIDRLPEIQGQPVIDSYKEAMQYGVAKRTLAEKQRAIDAANQEPDLQTRDRALKEVEAKDAANRFSGIGEGKMPDTAKAQEIIAAVDANPLKADVYSDFANRYKQIGDSLIDYAVKRGRISAEQGTAIKDSRDDYVSFKRVYDQIFQRQAFGSASNAPGQDHAIMHRYEGSDRIIEDPMVNLMQMTYDIMKESDLNRVRQDYVDLVDTANQVDPRVGNSILWEVPNKSEGTMTVYKNGQPHYYAGETMLMKQFKGLEGSTPSDNIALNAMRTAAQIFKGSVTHSPPFAFMNWMRAAVEYPLLSTAVTNPLQSVASTLDLFTKAGEKKASEAAQYGLGAQWYMKSRENFYKRQQTAIRELSRAPGSIVATDAKKLLEAYNKITDVSELGPRMAEFNKVLENEILRGADYESSMMKASAKAADLPNFALAGNLMQSLNRYVPFTNPAVQSVKTFVKAIYTHPVKAAATFATFMLLPRVMEYQWAAQNEERLRRWQNRPAHERDMFLNFELPSGRNEQGNYAPSYSVNLPIGFEFSVLSSGLSRMMDQVLGKNQMAFDGWDQSLKNALVPVDPDMFMSSLVGLPSELLTGYDAFQRRFFISPEEAKLPPEYRSGAKYASALGKAPAKSWNWALESMKKLTGKDLSGYKVDPRNIDQIIRRMGGRFGTMAQSLSNVATGQRGAESLLGSWVGLIRQLPAYAASDVNIVQQAAENTGQAAELDKLRKMKDMWYAETDPEKKNKILNDLLKYARFLRDGKLKLAIEDPEEYMRRLGKKKSF